MRIEWKDELATGNAEIDAQHREIFRRFNALLKACNAGAGRSALSGVLDYLDRYVAEHFKEEEKLQQQVGYPAYSEHRSQHEQFARKVTLLKIKFSTHGTSVQLVVQTGRLLADWLFEHITVTDKAFVDFLNTEREGTWR